MKYRTIEEARKVVIPELPQSFPNEFSNLAKIIQFGNESIVSKLNKIYFFTNKITKFMVCQKGCSHCCHINVAKYPRKINLTFQENSIL